MIANGKKVILNAIENNNTPTKKNIAWRNPSIKELIIENIVNPSCKGICIRNYDTRSSMGGNKYTVAKYPRVCRNCSKRFKSDVKGIRCPCCNVKFSLRIKGPRNQEGKPRI